MAYTILDFAEEVLSQSSVPLTFQEIWNHGVAAQFDQKLALTGKTPWATLGSRLYVDVRDNPKSRFSKEEKNPAKFFLAKRKEELAKLTICLYPKNRL